MKPSATSPYAPQPARSQVSRATPVDPGLLPVTRVALPHLRRPCILAARADKAAWSVEARDFVPVLDQIPLRPGANGVGTRKDADGVLVEDVTHIVSDLQRMRWRVVINGDTSLEAIVPEGRFLQTYPCERGLVATVPFWETPDVVSRDREIRWRTDESARHRFIVALLQGRHIDPITVEACREVYDQTAGTLAELVREERARAKSGAKGGDLADDIRRLEIRLAHMEARMAGQDPFELEGEPERERRRGKAQRLDAAPAQSLADQPPAMPASAMAEGTITLVEAQRLAEEAAARAVAQALAAQPARRSRRKADHAD